MRIVGMKYAVETIVESKVKPSILKTKIFKKNQLTRTSKTMTLYKCLFKNNNQSFYRHCYFLCKSP